MPEILPAVLPQSFEELSERLSQVSTFVKTVHIDACDGIFSPESSWPYAPGSTHFAELLTEEEGFPFWEKLDFEVHLMAHEPEKKFVEWIRSGALRIIVHVETLRDFSLLRRSAEDALTELVLALKFETPLEAISEYAEDVNGIHLMTIPRIGFQGVEFEPDSVLRVREARALFPGLPISVDGGISPENARELVEAGANRLIVGSALFESANPMEIYRKLKQAIS